MKNLSKAARVMALTMAALAATGGVAGAASNGNAPAAHGTVTAVNGNSAPGTCGTAGADGSFTLTATNSQVSPPKVTVTTVDVTAATSFLEHRVTSPTFGNVCVGDTSVVVGNASSFTIAATAVTIHTPPPAPKVHLYGAVTSVNGESAAGTCGTAGATGSFTLSTVQGTATVASTVTVDPSTSFTLKGASSASFDSVCVGYKATAQGTQTGSDVAASLVAVKIPPAPKPPKPLHVSGIVASINGVTAAGTCGTAGDAGSFTAVSTDNSTSPPTTTTWTVNVTAGTAFSSKNITSASFANVCVGGKTVALGTTTSGALDAIAVAAWAPKA